MRWHYIKVIAVVGIIMVVLFATAYYMLNKASNEMARLSHYIDNRIINIGDSISKVRETLGDPTISSCKNKAFIYEIADSEIQQCDAIWYYDAFLAGGYILGFTSGELKYIQLYGKI